ncbi:MAG TPA: ATP-binding protein [Ideonella sp.]|uniref:ATP-binding protein n=1 Tax=Ideonella sp. TaxID=1929293 RepID=UPI002E373804|nr:ATP-binding protein [Ideonella sp.]HEX5683509.1 ATP-binding protein [Ideonella sp.]
MGWLRRITPQSIGSKLTLAFGALIGITLLVVALGFVAGRRATQDINLTEGVRAPASLASAEAQASLLRMQLHVRGYLVLSDPQDLEQYQTAKASFERSLAELQAMSGRWAEEDARSVTELTQRYGRWAELPRQLFELHDNPLRNRPALRLARVEVQERRVHILADLDGMIGDQKAREATLQNRELLADLLRFQTSFDAMATNLMAYGASGELNFKLAYGPQLATNAAIWNQLVAKRGRLTAEQRAMFDNVTRLRAEVASLALEIVAILSGDRAYEDLYLYRTRVTPQAEDMLALLATVTVNQQRELQSGLARARLSLADGRLQTAVGGLFAVLIGVTMVFAFRRSIVEPAQRLTAVARRVAQGDLSARAAVESQDEIGVLARSITTMTERLVATIAHLESVFADAQRARDAAESANRAKSVFLANMSHELRTPLNAVLGYAQILQREPGLSQRETAALDTIRRSGEHLLTLINGVLDLARIEAGKVELYPETVNLPLMLNTVNGIIRLQAEGKGLAYRCEAGPELPQLVHVDGKRLDQVLLNLLSNAVKFTEHGAVTLRVQRLDGHHDHPGAPTVSLRFVVEDTGIGIAEDQLGGIFRPFEQGAEVQRRYGGAGLGLAISQQLVGLMGSEIRVESQRGQGSRFWFDLELPLAESTEPVEVAPRLGRRITGYQGRPRQLLVIDDVAGNRAMLVDYLGPLGFQMHEAASGEAGLELAGTLRPDLALIDNVMPGISGLETTRRLRQLPGLATLPIIMISASASAADVQSSLAVGADGFLPKPVDFDLLLSEIGRLLGLQWLPGPDVVPAPPPAQEAAPSKLPSEELQALYRLAQMGNMSGIRAQAEHLETLGPAHRPLARRLLDLAERFQSAAILQLVERLRDDTAAKLERAEEE